MKKVYGPILIGRSTFPMTDRFKPSNERTISALGFIIQPSIVSLVREFFGSTFKEDLVSTNTQDIIVPTHSMDMCRALL